ncbi:hypothetical protein PPERSA_11547 [Pseudocohnilembus persalinus]|uniref:Uncharacterized protein n=1 Tax=Pseudocohnilembus persalinus TaxID=266149 RepID=A0A0V0QXF5_PSEPJ|nr:hypothetical protein PPERSA_11547 [Pseudocohnilembus persalinus]|eukprot:KRX06902.1 hypothetical protein PPERSA_11547 [Pseudocohnilembus persalinus]
MKQLHKQKLEELKQDLENQVDVTQNELPLDLIKKEENYPLTHSDYAHFQKQNKYGKVNILNYKNSKITMVGTQYQFLPIKNIYKILRHSKPDVICLQVRPDQILNNFVVNIKNPETGYFSSSRYFKQIQKDGFEIMPSSQHRKRILQDLQKNNIFVSQIQNKDEQHYQNYQQQIKKQYKPYQHKERLSLDTIATASFYAERNNIPLILMDLPEIVFRQEIANQNTVMQLQQLFTKCARLIAREPDLKPHTPLSMAFQLYPQIFLEKSDQYMATVLQALHAKKFKNITCFLGNTQSDSLAEILSHRKTHHLADELAPAKVKHSLVRDITAEEIVEKHSILDVLMHGKDIVQDFENLEFQTTYEMIQRYGNPDHTDVTRLNKLRLLHYKLIQKYAKFAQQEYQIGQSLLKKEFLKKIGY